MNSKKRILGEPEGQFCVFPLYEMESISAHTHYFYEISYFARGVGTLFYNDHAIEIYGPILHFCPPHSAWHSFELADPKDRLLASSMAIYPALFGVTQKQTDRSDEVTDGERVNTENVHEQSPFSLLKQLSCQAIPVIDLKKAAALRLEALIELICEEYRLRLPGYLLRIGGCVQEILVVALREQQGIHIHPSTSHPIPENQMQSEKDRTSIKKTSASTMRCQSERFMIHHDQRVSQVVSYMKTHLDKQVPNAQLARHTGLKEKHFIHLFTSEVGMSPQRYYLQLRLEGAAQYLVNTSLPIGEIAGMFGFKHRTHFQASFRRNFQASPGLYRYVHRRVE